MKNNTLKKLIAALESYKTTEELSEHFDDKLLSIIENKNKDELNALLDLKKDIVCMIAPAEDDDDSEEQPQEEPDKEEKSA